jgi:hypothetical protein
MSFCTPCFSQEEENEEINKLQYEINKLKQENSRLKTLWAEDVEDLLQKIHDAEKTYSETDVKLTDLVEQAESSQTEYVNKTNARFLKYRKYIKLGFYLSAFAFLLLGLWVIYLFFLMRKKNMMVLRKTENDYKNWSLSLAEMENKLQKRIEDNKMLFSSELKKQSEAAAERFNEIKQSIIETEEKIQKNTSSALEAEKQGRAELKESLLAVINNAEQTKKDIQQKIDEIKNEVLVQTKENLLGLEKEIKKIKTDFSAEIEKLHKKTAKKDTKKE